MNESDFIDRYIDALSHDPNAAPPPELDADTVAFVRALVLAEQPSKPSASTQDRVWHRALSMAENIPASNNNHLPTNNNRVEQRVTLLKSDTRLHDEDTTDSSIDAPIQVKPTTRSPRRRSAWQVTLTTVAAALILVLIGGVLIEMVTDPIDGYPAVADLTQVPKCTAATIADLTAEAARLATDAEGVLSAEGSPQLAALLAVCGLRTGYSAEADSALQASLRSFGAITEFTGQTLTLNSAIFAPNDQDVVIASSDATYLWDIATQEKIGSFPYDRPLADSNPVAISPDGKMLLTFYQYGIARLWDVETGEMIADFDTGRRQAISALAFSPDGQQAALGLIGGMVQLWDVDTWRMLRSFSGGWSTLNSLTYSPDGQSLLTTFGMSSDAELWDAATVERIATISGHTGKVNTAVFSPDGQFILTASRDMTIMLHNVETGEIAYTFDGFDAEVNTAVFSPDGQLILVGGMDKTVRLYDLETGDEIRRFPLNDNIVTSVGFSPDGQTVLMGSVGAGVLLWPVSVEDTITLACTHLTRDFTAAERAQYGLGDGAACP